MQGIDGNLTSYKLCTDMYDAIFLLLSFISEEITILYDILNFYLQKLYATENYVMHYEITQAQFINL